MSGARSLDAQILLAEQDEAGVAANYALVEYSWCIRPSRNR